MPGIVQSYHDQSKLVCNLLFTYIYVYFIYIFAAASDGVPELIDLLIDMVVRGRIRPLCEISAIQPVFQVNPVAFPLNVTCLTLRTIFNFEVLMAQWCLLPLHEKRVLLPSKGYNGKAFLPTSRL